MRQCADRKKKNLGSRYPLVVHAHATAEMMTNATMDDDPSTAPPIVSLSDPWTIAAFALFSLLAAVALYRTSRACCTCKIQSASDRV